MEFNFWLIAAFLGIGVYWLAGIRNELRKIRELLEKKDK
jgi:hypothetical protein